MDAGVSEELMAAWSESKRLLVAAGATVDEIDLPTEFSTSISQSIFYGENRVNYLAEHIIAKDKLHPLIVDRVEQTSPSRKELLKALDLYGVLRPRIDEIAQKYDAIITPSVPGIAPTGLGFTGDQRFCKMWTALHVPCLNIPAFNGPDGMPLGLTLVAAR
jgi:Asp-tRNA(Asn)/Glu-tRNA(Gln) amidotransferase A subunit family amidase